MAIDLDLIDQLLVNAEVFIGGRACKTAGTEPFSSPPGDENVG